MPEPKISVILATYNSAATLRRCLDSFRGQSYRRKELLVMDGGSSDGTLEILEANRDIIFYSESARDGGIYNAWNKALPRASGDWLYFIGADDYFLGPTALEEAAALLSTAFPDYRVAYGPVDLVNAAGAVWRTAGEPWDRARFLREMSLPHQGVFQHRTLFSEHGAFDESFRIAGDYELLLRELKERDALFLPGLKVAAMTYGGMSSGPGHSLAAVAEIFRARRKHGLKGWPLPLCWAYFKALCKALLGRVLGERAAGRAVKFYRRVSGGGAV